jgi:hypothetical protein
MVVASLYPREHIKFMTRMSLRLMPAVHTHQLLLHNGIV